MPQPGGGYKNRRRIIPIVEGKSGDVKFRFYSGYSVIERPNGTVSWGSCAVQDSVKYSTLGEIPPNVQAVLDQQKAVIKKYKKRKPVSEISTPVFPFSGTTTMVDGIAVTTITLLGEGQSFPVSSPAPPTTSISANTDKPPKKQGKAPSFAAFSQPCKNRDYE